MCGITGYINHNIEDSADAILLKRMTDCISYRGPDGEGFYVKENVALGHRRLSILDIDTGNQPMYNHDRSKVIVFNGEIYNYLELKNELQLKGITFQTNSDTEVILAAYDFWGYDCMNKFNGMWAFAIWDTNRNELVISRDRIGEKPLHYFHSNTKFVFGSEIKSIIAAGIVKEIRPELIETFLSVSNIPAPNTFFKNIYKLMPGHFMTIKNGELKENRYWDLPEIDENNMLKDKPEIYEKFEFLFKDSVKIRMRSDVPFGAFLSGGLDSSSVVAIMSQLSEQRIKTFTIGFDDKSYDETLLAKSVSDAFKTEHFRETVLPENIDQILNKIYSHYDEPFGDPSAIPTGIISKFAAQYVKMVLTGDGGDEVLSGYSSYQGIKLSNLINLAPFLIRKNVPIISDSIAKLTKGRVRYKLNKASEIIRTSDLDFVEKMTAKKPTINLEKIKSLTKNIENSISINSYYNALLSKCTYKNDFYKLMYLNFKHDLPNDYLVKVDRMSMAYSLEARLPFLDYRLIEYMAKVDKNVKMQGWERKSVLRKTIGKQLPSSILNAPKKGFGVPLREWFKSDNFENYLIQNTSKISELTNKTEIKRIISENKSGNMDYGYFIWNLLILNKHL
jgi:asparagine synthase (glutamine-hydrolysing)